MWPAIPAVDLVDDECHVLELQDVEYQLWLDATDLLSLPAKNPFEQARGLLLENRLDAKIRGNNPITLVAQWNQFVASKCDEDFANWMKRSPIVHACAPGEESDWIALARLCRLIDRDRGTVRAAVLKLAETQRRKRGRSIEVRYSVFRNLALKAWDTKLESEYRENS